ncbi:unnamed protein product, partial [Gongylonema pulchrum]|uniref:EGF-like domain-containing protein n=1 Tax=Gongylonema pulchrum TaxID=637853 RepID=A0A183D2X6_9BILA
VKEIFSFLIHNLKSVFLFADFCIHEICANVSFVLQGKCHCQERFEGEACEIEPCLHGGRKSRTGKCQCPYGLTGERCETVTQCIEGKGRLVNGRCKCEDRWTGMGSFCLCDIGFTGPFCETPIECIHGTITAENFCSCEPNWAGEDCSQCAYVRNPKAVNMWSLTLVASAAVLFVVLVASTATIYMKKCRSKPSRVSSDAGTDV